MLRRAPFAALVLAVPLLAPALEPRFDHRDTHGPFAEVLGARDTLSRTGGGSVSSWRPAGRIGWGFDATGNGDEVRVAAAMALRSLDDPDRERVLLSADARYRAYFGTEEAKTFFDLGLWVPIRSRLAVGPLVGLGVAYDFSRAGGVYLSAGFATAFGEARVASFEVAVGGQFRFELL